ncbi:MAG: ferrochelatase, partial [Thiogranum sp.]
MTSYIGTSDFRHDQDDCTGILLVNLGTTEAPTRDAVRRYLAEFLWDPRVIEIARPLWWLILHGVILRLRPSKVARAYQSIWTDKGSPLLAISERLS